MRLWCARHRLRLCGWNIGQKRGSHVSKWIWYIMEHNYCTIGDIFFVMEHKCGTFMVHSFWHMERCYPTIVLHLLRQHLCYTCTYHKCVTFIRTPFIEHLFPMYICCIHVARARQGGHKWTICTTWLGCPTWHRGTSCITFVMVCTSMVPLM